MKNQSLKKEDLQSFGEELGSIDLSEILDMKDDAFGAFDRMMGIIQSIYDMTCSWKCLKPHKDEPWITMAIS